MINIVELIADAQHPSPCRFGNIVDDHACYCHYEQGPRKCPVWRNYGEDLDKWHNRGDWNDDNWLGGCRYFEPQRKESYRQKRDAKSNIIYVNKDGKVEAIK